MILWSARYLEERGVEEARLDAEHLLAHALGVKRLQLYLEYDRPLDDEELAAFKPLLLRRAGREPLQYVVGSTAFRELDLATDARALIPRPETEMLVERVLEWAGERDRGLTAVDIGTGCGCVALSLASEGAFDAVTATDLSAEALTLARENAEASGLDVRFLEGDLFEPLDGARFDVVVANLPYISPARQPDLAPEIVDWEPLGALVAADDGLALLRRLVAAAGDHLNPGGLLALEVGLGQAEEVARLVAATADFGPPRIEHDLNRRPRFVMAERSDDRRTIP